MKKLSYFFALAIVYMTTMASTCSNDDNSTTPANPTPVINTATAGSWKVTYYFDTDSDETAHFANYVFTFGANNVLTATDGTNTYTGTWSVTDSHTGSHSRSGSDDNSNSGDLDFNISFTSPASFAELTDDWDIVTYSATQIQLTDVSGGNGGTDYLTFEKL